MLLFYGHIYRVWVKIVDKWKLMPYRNYLCLFTTLFEKLTFHRMNTNIHAHKDHLCLYIAFSVLFRSLSQSRFIVETILFSTTNSFLWQIIILNWTYFKLTFCYHAYFWSNQSLSTYYVNGIINPLPVHINYFLLFFIILWNLVTKANWQNTLQYEKHKLTTHVNVVIA